MSRTRRAVVSLVLLFALAALCTHANGQGGFSGVVATGAAPEPWQSAPQGATSFQRGMLWVKRDTAFMPNDSTAVAGWWSAPKSVAVGTNSTSFAGGWLVYARAAASDTSSSGGISGSISAGTAFAAPAACIGVVGACKSAGGASVACTLRVWQTTGESAAVLKKTYTWGNLARMSDTGVFYVDGNSTLSYSMAVGAAVNGPNFYFSFAEVDTTFQ